jgi:archaellum biogenesis ATPase FlaH
MPAFTRDLKSMQSDYETLRKYANDYPEYITEPLLDRTEHIKRSLETPLRNNKTGLLKADAYAFFNISIEDGAIIWHDTDTDIICKSLAYDWQIVSRYTDSENNQKLSIIESNLSKYGRPSQGKYHYANYELVAGICAKAGLKVTATKDNAQDKTADNADVRREQRAKRTPRANKPKDGVTPTMPIISAQQPVPTRSAQAIDTGTPQITKPSEQSEPVTPVIGTPYPSNGLNLVIYKPSEADTKPDRLAIIDKYFYADTINLLYGQAGSYKTFWAIWEGISLVLGKELCGLPIETTGHKVLYVSLEMTAKDIANRMSRMTKDLTEAERKTVDDNFIIISAEDTPLTANNPNVLKALKDVCTSYGTDIIYIDSLTDYVAGNDIRSEGDMTAIINDLRQFVLENHVSFRIIHHGTKPTQDSNGSMAGIHTIRDLCDYVFLIKADSENEVKISSNMQLDKSAKSRYSEPLTILTKFVSADDSISFVKLSENQTSSYIERLQKLLTIVEENQGITSKDLRKELGYPKDYNRLVDGAVDAGSIIINSEKSDRGSSKKCHYTPTYYHAHENEIKKNC